MAPLARFHKLDDEKRAAIVEAAAAEFSAHGFDGASINRIIAAAGISKGAVYYYFEDKADLFVTVVDIYTRRAGFDLSAVAEAADTDAFWRRLNDVIGHAWRFTRDNPHWIGLGRAFARIPRETWSRGRFGEYMNQHLVLVGRVVSLGQRLGAVRDDLPVEALAALTMGALEAFERYIFTVWETLDGDARAALFDACMHNVYRLLLPFPADLFAAWHPETSAEEES